MGLGSADRGTGNPATANRLSSPDGPWEDPSLLWGLEGQSAIPEALADALDWQLQLDDALLHGPVENIYPLAEKLVSAWRFLLDAQAQSQRDPRDRALLITDLAQQFRDAKITVEIVESPSGEGIPVTKTWQDAPLPVWAPSKFPVQMPKELIDRYPKRPRDIAQLPPFAPPNVRSWLTILDRGPQRTRTKKSGSHEYDLIPIVSPPLKDAGNQEQLQATLDKTMKAVTQRLTNLKIDALGIGRTPGIADAIKALGALTAADLGRATDLEFKTPWKDTPIIQMTEVMLYHSVYSVVLDKTGEPFDLLGRLDYAILVPPPGSQMQRNIPKPGVYVSVQHYGDGDFRIVPRPIDKVLFGGVGAFTEYGYGASSPHEYQKILQSYLDSYSPGYLAALSTMSVFKPGELSTSSISDKMPPLIDAALAATAVELKRRLQNDLENYQDFLESLAKDIIKKLIYDKIRDEVIEYLVKKVGAKIVPLINVASAVYDMITGGDSLEIRNALAAMILAIKGTQPDDMTIAAKILGKIVSNRIYEKIRQALIDKGAKVVKGAAAKVHPKPQAAPAPEPAPGEPAPPAAEPEPPPDEAAAKPAPKPHEPAVKPLSADDIAEIARLQAAQKKQLDEEHARGTASKATHDREHEGSGTEDTGTHPDDPMHVVGSRIRGEPEGSTQGDEATRGTASAHDATASTAAAPANTAAAPANTAATNGAQAARASRRTATVEPGSPAVPPSIGGPLEFQTHIDQPAHQVIGGVGVTSRSPDVLVGSRKPQFRDDVAAVINADPHHPMRAMLNPQTVGTRNPDFVQQAYGSGGHRDEEWRRHPEDWQAGHMRSGHMGDADVLVVQSRYRNQMQSNFQESGGVGEVTHDYAVVIGHIAVEGQTAWDLWHAGYIDLSFDQMEALPKLPL